MLLYVSVNVSTDDRSGSLYAVWQYLDHSHCAARRNCFRYALDSTIAVNMQSARFLNPLEQEARDHQHADMVRVLFLR